MTACPLGQVAECRGMNGESGLPWPVEIRNCQRRVREWSTDSVDRKTVEHDLHTKSERMVDDMHRTYGEVNDSLEREQTEGGLERIDH